MKSLYTTVLFLKVIILSTFGETTQQWIPNRIIANRYGTISVYDPYTYNNQLYTLKGQMHCHTNCSDGTLSPEEMAVRMKKDGYDFFSITDHNVITSEPINNEIIWLGDAVEHTTNFHHITMYNIDRLYSPNPDLNALIDSVKGSNHEAIFNLCHPDREPIPQSNEKIVGIRWLNFIEICNRTIEQTRAWDSLLTNNKLTFGIAVEDFHYPKHPAHNNTGWVEVLTREKTRESIWKSLLIGNFYASSGAKMECSLDENGCITVFTDPGSLIRFIGKHGEVLQEEDNKTESRYIIHGNEGYIRCEVLNEARKKCWSQPYMIGFSNILYEDKCFEPLHQESIEVKNGKITITSIQDIKQIKLLNLMGNTKTIQLNNERNVTFNIQSTGIHYIQIQFSDNTRSTTAVIVK